MNSVNDAIILAGGLGSRMLPASSYVPKEVLPLVDTPLINHLIWEASKAGVKKIHIVISQIKFETMNSVLNKEKKHWAGVRPDLPRLVLEVIPKGVEILFHEQIKPGGVGDAIATAISHIEGPFLVLLGDNVIMDMHNNYPNEDTSLASNGSKKLVDFYIKTGMPCAGLIEVHGKEIEKYGVVEFNGNLINKIIEKPKIEQIPSRYVLCGRYLLPPNTADILIEYPLEKFGELQSIAIFDHFINNGGFGGVKFHGFSMYDSGDPLSWLKSQIDHAMKRIEYKNDIIEWLELKLNQKN